jgi:hypothetical protein
MYVIWWSLFIRRLVSTLAFDLVYLLVTVSITQRNRLSMSQDSHSEGLNQDESLTKDNHSKLLEAVGILSGSTNQKNIDQKSMEEVLRLRLENVKALGLENLPLTELDLNLLTLEVLQYQTASLSLDILERLSVGEQNGKSLELSLSQQGTLKTLVAILFRWKVTNDTDKFNKPTTSGRKETMQELLKTTTRLLRIMFPDDKPDQTPQTSNRIGTILLHNSVPEILPAMFSLGWLPPGECTEGAYIRASALRILNRCASFIHFPLIKYVLMHTFGRKVSH